MATTVPPTMEPRPVAFVTLRMPALTRVTPPKLLAPPRTSVPTPVLVRSKPPLIAPVIVSWVLESTLMAVPLPARTTEPLSVLLPPKRLRRTAVPFNTIGSAMVKPLPRIWTVAPLATVVLPADVPSAVLL